MQIILLSGGSGTRLWPLSNDARSKQFLKLLPSDEPGRTESMIQRVVRQIREADIHADLTVATSKNQQDSVISQIGDAVSLVVEPSRRNTFPAICLACRYLKMRKNCPDDDTVIVMPCDPFTDASYFEAIKRMASGVASSDAELMVMGITPTYPSAKYGYVLPAGEARADSDIIPVARFVEKPTVEEAESLIARGALWNGGVFGFKLSYLLDIVDRYLPSTGYQDTLDHYDLLPRISFDYEVAEKARSVAMVPFRGSWKDLGTWNTLTDELPLTTYGNVVTDDTAVNTHIINELDIPLLCMGTRDLIIAASPDGIIVSEKKKSENIKHYAERLKDRPMYEERRWGYYKVLGHAEFPDGYCVLTKQLTLNPGCAISYQSHTFRDETWTFIDGEGEIVLDGETRPVRRGDTVFIPKGMRHALRALTPLTFIELQSGTNLVEEDIARYPFDWSVGA